MRILSDNIKEVLQQTSYTSHDIVELTIPEYRYFDEEDEEHIEPEVTLYMSTSELNIDGHIYHNLITSLPQIRFTLSPGADNTQLTIDNILQEFGFILVSDRQLENSKVVIKRAFWIDKNKEFETDTIFVGYVRDVKVDEKNITLTFVSDISRRGATVASYGITQHCIRVFRKVGDCDWTPDQPGDPEFCDKNMFSPKGCQAHGNSHRLKGVPNFSTLTHISNSGYDNTPPIIGGGGVGGAGGGNPGNPYPWCVIPDTWIYLPDNKIIRIKDITIGDKILSVDLFGNIVTSEVMGIVEGFTNKIVTIGTIDFSITGSPSHPLVCGLGDNKGIPMIALKPKFEDILTWKLKHKKARPQEIFTKEIINVEHPVITLQLAPYHTFIASNETTGGIVSHNVKDWQSVPSHPTHDPYEN